MVMFDSLNRHMLSPYGCDWAHTPNFQRLARKTVTFTNSFIGSMPCMPARREIHTGRYNFLHRSWGPIEPFDDSMPEILKNNGITTHLISDHYHYWEDGGCTYHPRYSSWEISRGQEGDPWKCHLPDNIDIPESLNGDRGTWGRQDWVNRHYMKDIKDQPQPTTFRLGLEFLETNHNSDNWFLTIETFDPHEPYFSDQKYKDLYPSDYKGSHWDWPPYEPVSQTREQVKHMRRENAALVSMCDEHLGKVLDFFDEHNMWDDTLLIVNTDHGFLLGEREAWGKCWFPFYNEIAHTPLFIWDPRCRRADQESPALVQTIDLAPTLLDYFNVPIPPDMQGSPLKDAIAHDTPVHDAIIFGIHGGHVNCTDGRYLYMRGPKDESNSPLYEYTLMPTHMRGRFFVEELQDIQLAEPFTFTKGCRTMKIAYGRKSFNYSFFKYGTMLFDLENDPKQETPIQNPQIEKMMTDHLCRLMKENDAPSEQFQRLGLI